VAVHNGDEGSVLVGVGLVFHVGAVALGCVGGEGMFLLVWVGGGGRGVGWFS